MAFPPHVLQGFSFQQCRFPDRFRLFLEAPHLLSCHLHLCRQLTIPRLKFSQFSLGMPDFAVELSRSLFFLS